MTDPTMRQRLLEFGDTRVGELGVGDEEPLQPG